jgi:hypothetical protein
VATVGNDRSDAWLFGSFYLDVHIKPFLVADGVDEVAALNMAKAPEASGAMTKVPSRLRGADIGIYCEP